MAVDVLSIPASSVDVERLFSKAKQDDSPLRQSMDPVFKGELQIAKSWILLSHKINKKYSFVYLSHSKKANCYLRLFDI